MSTIIRAQCSWQVGSMLPRDRFTITPHFEHQQIDLSDVDYQALADDLATGLKTWEKSPTNHELTVKLYNLNDPAPRRPKAIAVRQPNAAQDSNWPRELALCLSYRGGAGGPRQRGRLFVPHCKMTVGNPSVRPTQTERDNVAALVPLFSGLGGINVDWVVYSPTTRQTTKVSDWYVDDEWDVQRRRGLKPTTRSAGTTGG